MYNTFESALIAWCDDCTSGKLSDLGDSKNIFRNGFVLLLGNIDFSKYRFQEKDGSGKIVNQEIYEYRNDRNWELLFLFMETLEQDCPTPFFMCILF